MSRKPPIKGPSTLMEQREALRDYTKVRAPYDGTITARFADPGALIQIATASATGRHSIVHDHGSEHGPRLCQCAAGRELLDRPREDQGVPDLKELPGSLLYGNGDTLDSRSRSLDTQPPDRDRFTQSGPCAASRHVCGGLVGLRVIPHALVLPPQAIISGAKGKSLFIIDQGRAKSIPVQTGITDGVSMEITSGLSGDEEVVVVGKRKLLDGASVYASPFNLPDAKPSSQKFERRTAGRSPPSDRQALTIDRDQTGAPLPNLSSDPSR